MDGKGPLSGLKIEPFVANDPEVPCETDEASLVDDQIVIPGVGTVSIRLLGSGTNGSGSSVGFAQASPVRVVLEDPTGNLIAGAAVAPAAALAVCGPDGDSFQSSSSVLVAGVGEPVNRGVVVPLGPMDLGIPGVVIVHLNSTTLSGNKVIQRAVWIETPLADVIVGEAIADCEFPAAA